MDGNTGAGTKSGTALAAPDGLLTMLPAWIGMIDLIGEQNAASSKSDNTRYLPSLTEDTAYITTKKANSSVMKSAYETSQRS